MESNRSIIGRDIERVLVVAAHPDDEVLGCGGTIARYASAGTRVTTIFLADGVASRGTSDRQEQQRCQAAMDKAAKCLGLSEVEFYQLPDNQLDTAALLKPTQIVERAVRKYQPDLVLTHHAGDVDVDHQRVHQAVITACRPQPGHPAKTLLFLEVPSSTEWQPPGSAPPFLPNWFVDIEAHRSAKHAAFLMYEEEWRNFPHPRSIEALECWRGATVGVKAAGAFMLGRQIQ
ncbi:MAG: PIG-L deacetylase family protein [Geitlerinemataceae cyanobacterium]